ncbi:MAG: Quaternary ammonium compound-resistance protein SugE [Myxococcota bacterium]|nr:Quaternary ammonium compound-resistance protein SugE [Myxococcota bacterium]
MPWIYLIIAGLMETAWAIGLKYTKGFTVLLPSVLTGAAIAASMFFLSLAVRDIPIGTAYAVWTGIGAFGAAVLGIVLFQEPAQASRIFFLVLLAVAIAGLKWSSPPG